MSPTPPPEALAPAPGTPLPALVVFDLAGTTVHDGGQVPAAFTAALGEHGLAVSAQQIASLRGASKHQAVVELLPAGPRREELAARIYEDFRRHLRARYEASGVVAVDGAERVFAWLRRRGVRVALGTGFDRAVTDLLLARLGWGPGVVDAVVCGDEVAAGRPAPDLILAAMRCCDVAAVARVAAVGDTVRDLEAGARAGVRWNVGVTSGAHDRATLSRAPHTHLLASVAELPALWEALWEGSAGASPLPPAAGDLRIVPFRDELAPDFERLNRQWLVANGLLEEGDLPYLQRPREKIVEAGGAVFFALLDGTVVGTVAALPLGERTWELAKLAVDGGARGRGIGRRLTTTAIDFAAAAGARRIVLSSSSRLRAAVRLYESMGFRHSRVGAGVPYATADVFMELALGAAGDSPPSAVSAAP